MIFENAYITTAGHALLTRATAGSKIIWGACCCYSQNLNDASQPQINALTSLSGAVALGSASAVFEHGTGTSGTARITCQCDNTSPDVSPGYAYSFGLWAKIDGDEAEKLVVVARTGIHTATYFPQYLGASTRLIGVVDLAVTIESGAASTINLVTSLFALASNLQTEINAREELAGRVVTTHAEGDVNLGEAQIIKGEKTFKEGVKTNTIKGEQGSAWASFGNGVYQIATSKAGIQGREGTYDAEIKCIVKDPNENIKSGMVLKSDESDKGRIELYVQDGTDKYGIITEYDSEHRGYVTEITGQMVIINGLDAEFISAKEIANVEEILPLGSSATIGSNQKKFKEIHTKEIHANKLTMYKNSETVSMECGDNAIDNKQSLEVNGNIIATGGILGRTVGQPDAYTTTVTVFIGGVILGIVKANSGAQGLVGERLTNNTDIIWIAKSNGTSMTIWSQGRRLIGTFIALMDFDPTTDAVVLLQRVE